jgi:hypothetical protein
MKKFKLLVLGLLALTFSAPVGFRTANAKVPKVGDVNTPDDQPPPEDSEVGLLIKGAGVDYKDVLWRIRAGLTPKQAVEVALNEKREAAGEQPNELSDTEKAKLAKGESIAADAPPPADPPPTKKPVKKKH